jgi:hypothetical protein
LQKTSRSQRMFGEAAAAIKLSDGVCVSSAFVAEANASIFRRQAAPLQRFYSDGNDSACGWIDGTGSIVDGAARSVGRVAVRGIK